MAEINWVDRPYLAAFGNAFSELSATKPGIVFDRQIAGLRAGRAHPGSNSSRRRPRESIRHFGKAELEAAVAVSEFQKWNLNQTIDK
ncbi:MAG: hypothetical protein OXI87_12235 [Albidovulum sp.]|nr:hypothetical protein [Albidovulum sp.]MDE0305628.1 hypothetical protein [Albidovulum sp.]MDE0533650.1 hypothetical protein [Albidovulum sp.]